jgi:hypothetical protein
MIVFERTISCHAESASTSCRIALYSGFAISKTVGARTNGNTLQKATRGANRVRRDWSGLTSALVFLASEVSQVPISRITGH